MTERGKRGFGLSSKAKDDLIGRVLKKRRDKSGQSVDTTDVPVARSGPRRKVPASAWQFDKFPDYQQMQMQKLGAERLGIENPFFQMHDAVAGATTRIGDRPYINFSSYNYLGLCGDPRVSEAARRAIDSYGTSVSASRLVSGERPLHRELERELAQLYGVEDSLAFVSGHATNVTSIGYLFGPKDLILHDALIHNSVLQGALLSGAKRMAFAHNDWEDLERLLARHRDEYERVLVVVEGIYSMDGDFPELPRFIDIKQRYKAILMVDEAHSLGVMGARGRGIGEHFGLKGPEVDIWMGTLSKTLASCGGYIAGSHALVDMLKFAAPGFLYSVGLAPPTAAAALAALRAMQAEPERVATLQQRGRFFLEQAQARGVDTGTSSGLAVIPAIVGSSVKAARLSNAMVREGVNVQPIVYPAVEEQAARLRFFINAQHTEEQILQTLDTLVTCLDAL